MPECSFRGRQNKKLQFAVLAAAALHGGTEPDLLDEVAWWQTDDFWEYALFAAVAYIRAAANRAGVPTAQACQELAPRPADPGPSHPGTRGDERRTPARQRLFGRDARAGVADGERGPGRYVTSTTAANTGASAAGTTPAIAAPPRLWA